MSTTLDFNTLTMQASTIVRFATDTATLCLFDETALHHRFKDDADWWSDPYEELEEVNNGNVMFVALGTDGTYTAHINPVVTRTYQPTVKAKLRCPSGRLFIGPGEDVIGGGVRPDTNLGGEFFEITPASYMITVVRSGRSELEVTIAPFEGEARNAFTSSLSLE